MLKMLHRKITIKALCGLFNILKFSFSNMLYIGYLIELLTLGIIKNYRIIF